MTRMRGSTWAYIRQIGRLTSSLPSLRCSEELGWSEDFLFNLEYIRYCQRFASIQLPLYYYYKTKNSITATSGDPAVKAQYAAQMAADGTLDAGGVFVVLALGDLQLGDLPPGVAGGGADVALPPGPGEPGIGLDGT